MTAVDVQPVPTGSDSLVEAFVAQWRALSGDAWMALGGRDAVRTALVDAIKTLAPTQPRRVAAWVVPMLEPLELPRLLADLGCSYTPWVDTDPTQDPPSPESRLRLRDEVTRCSLGITTCEWAVADTGTIALYATASQGRLPSLLPVAHLTLVRPSQVVRDIPGAIRQLGLDVDLRGAMPSAVQLISGPSRTADIEGDLAVGVHGPARAGVIVGDW